MQQLSKFVNYSCGPHVSGAEPAAVALSRSRCLVRGEPACTSRGTAQHWRWAAL